MTKNEMKKLMNHFNKYFEQEDPVVLHPINMNPHIDILKYAPTEKYHFWKLATMGACDYKMNGKNSLGDRNEYMMFIDADENLDDNAILDWYYTQLLEIALYPVLNNEFLSYGHSLEWKIDEGEEIAGAFMEFPQIIKDTGILRCKLGLMKTVICLQAVLLMKSDMELLMNIGPERFSEYLYPENGKEQHFLSERIRSDKF